jgi:hypothetical protein
MVLQEQTNTRLSCCGEQVVAGSKSPSRHAFILWTGYEAGDLKTTSLYCLFD